MDGQIPQFAEPLWLVARTDQKIAELRDNLTADRLAGFKAVLISLFDPAPGIKNPDEERRWDRTCDNCGKYCEVNTPFYIGRARRDMHGKHVFLEFGACPECMGLPA